MQKMDLDPSLAFTAQLELAPGLTSDEGAQWRSGLLEAWYRQNTVTNFWSFARQWAFERKVSAAGDRLDTEITAAGDDPGLKSDAWERYFEAEQEAGDAFRAAKAARS